ncbi:MAG: DNA mismatch repair endonuclease MutL [Oscillospiraceae bacterium]|nr:DNA mismatch repair endonuclease MutL [Oscillospiraceae bacterium]
MAEINVLSKDISELIAAGEVIERPASVIKELLENAIDAGSKHITVEIKNGGTTYMRITDDGCGIAPNQVATAFLRHATSKITTKDDLENILTLGFRGEALASISAVSRAEVLTKRRGDEYGTNYIIEGGHEVLNEQTGCPDGTTIIIRDIFYNVPVRRKFMKRDSAEANAVISIMQKIVLSHPEIAFKLIKDNKLEFSSAGDGELYSAVYAVYGRDFAHDMIPVDYKENNITVKGFTVKPLYSKSNRSFQNFFINGRYVKSVTCCVSLEEAYKNLIMTGKFPACVLMLEAPPVTVDVNVHPAKAEVRFSDEKIIFNSVYFAVKNALMESGLIYEFQVKNENAKRLDYKEPFVPENFQQVKLEPEKKVQTAEVTKQQDNTEPEAVITDNQENRNYDESLTKPQVKEEKVPVVLSSSKDTYGAGERIVFDTSQSQASEIKEKQEADETISGFSYISSAKLKRTESQIDQSPKEQEESDEKEEIKVQGEMFGNYIVAQSGEKMIIIDKHAAHERIIFERLKRSNTSSDSQLLINSCSILLSGTEFEALNSNNQILENMGFSLDFSGKPYVKLNAVPILLEKLNMDEVIPEIAENLIMNKMSPQTHMLDDILHDLACKAAVKANDKNTAKELQKLAEDVFYDENIRHCPHGRPIMFVLTKREIEKNFKRIL